LQELWTTVLRPIKAVVKSVYDSVIMVTTKLLKHRLTLERLIESKRSESRITRVILSREAMITVSCCLCRLNDSVGCNPVAALPEDPLCTLLSDLSRGCSRLLLQVGGLSIALAFESVLAELIGLVRVHCALARSHLAMSVTGVTHSNAESLGVSDGIAATAGIRRKCGQDGSDCLQSSFHGRQRWRAVRRSRPAAGVGGGNKNWRRNDPVLAAARYRGGQSRGRRRGASWRLLRGAGGAGGASGNGIIVDSSGDICGRLRAGDVKATAQAMRTTGLSRKRNLRCN
jgi:hypothetical protein